MKPEHATARARIEVKKLLAQLFGTCEKDEIGMSDYFDELERLKSWGFFEVYKRTDFKCYRKSKSGDIQHITLEIFDRGPKHPATRYQVVATRDDGNYATGNPSDTLSDALSLVHWWVLDEPGDNKESPAIEKGPIEAEGSERDN
jgi:hypothetical protein